MRAMSRSIRVGSSDSRERAASPRERFQGSPTFCPMREPERRTALAMFAFCAALSGGSEGATSSGAESWAYPPSIPGFEAPAPFSRPPFASLFVPFFPSEQVPR